MNVNQAFENNDVAAVLECYTDFITNDLNKKHRKRGGKQLQVPFSLWKNANGIRPFLEENLITGWERWEKIISDFQKDNAKDLPTLCPKFATTFPTVVKEKIKNQKETQKKFDKSVENAIEQFEQKEFNIPSDIKSTANPEVSEIIFLISSGATEIVSPGGWTVKVQS